MKNKYAFVTLLLLGILIVSVGLTGCYVSQTKEQQEEDFVVVTSFYPMYIAAMNVIGDTQGITLKNLSEPQTGCLHDFQLTPADMKLLSTADVFIINGGGIESFMEEIASQYPQLTIISACEGMELLCEEHQHGDDGEHDHEHDHEHGNVNAHVWMSVAMYREQIQTIAQGLAAADEENSASYLANCESYDGKLSDLQKKQEKIRQLFAENKEVILLHSAYEYLALDYGLETAFCMDLDEERQVSAGEVAQVIGEIEKHGITYLFAEELYAKEMCEMIQNEAEVEVIYLDPLTRGEYDADSYLNAMQVNMEKLEALFTLRNGGQNEKNHRNLRVSLY